MTDEKSIGLIGVGLLGSAMAERFLAAGFEVVGYDVDPARRKAFASLGGRDVDSARLVAQQCRRILLSLPDSSIAGTVVDEILSELKSGTILIDTTTGDPETMAETGRKLVEHEIQYLDATVGGSSTQTRDGDVIVMVGGEEETFQACRDLFDCFARESFHVGPCGNGARMKLVVNLVLGLNRAVLAEGLAFARNSGLDLEETLRIFQAGPAYSRAMDVKGRKMLDEEFSPQARLSQHLKDVRLILAVGDRSNAKLPFSTLHRQLLEQLETAGYGDADNSAVIKFFD